MKSFQQQTCELHYIFTIQQAQMFNFPFLPVLLSYFWSTSLWWCRPWN